MRCLERVYGVAIGVPNRRAGGGCVWLLDPRGDAAVWRWLASFLLGPELLAYDHGVVAEPVLWQYNFSNFNEKVRWALDYKGVAHVRRSLLPNTPRAVLFSVRGTLPVLDLDGQRIVDSTRIIEALEGRYPQPALYPVDVDERRRALELEDFFDEHVGHEVRRALFYEQRDNLDYVGALLTTGRGAMTRRVYRALMSLPGSTSYQKRRYRFYGPDAERARRDVAAGLDRIVTELGPSGYLVGSRFTVADLTAAALLYPLAWPAELQYDYPEPPPSQLTESLCEHPGVDWIREIYRRHRGSSAAIPVDGDLHGDSSNSFITIT